MPDRFSKTTIKISQRVINFIQKRARDGEPLDHVLRRLLGLKRMKYVPPLNCMMKLVKISREVMIRIQREAAKDESRDQTLGRLLGIPGDYGNVLADGEIPEMPKLPAGNGSAHTPGNVRSSR